MLQQVMRKELEHHLVIKEQNVLLHENNKELKSQIETYCDKFSDFQSTLTKSNEVRRGSGLGFCPACFRASPSPSALHCIAGCCHCHANWLGLFMPVWVWVQACADPLAPCNWWHLPRLRVGLHRCSRR